MEMTESHRRTELIAVVDQLELILRRMDLWSEQPPAAASLASEQPFCFDTLAFSEWLQWLLIPRMRAIFAAGGVLPTRSAIQPYAEECVADGTADRAKLLALIGRFDALICGAPAATTH